MTLACQQLASLPSESKEDLSKQAILIWSQNVRGTEMCLAAHPLLVSWSLIVNVALQNKSLRACTINILQSHFPISSSSHKSLLFWIMSVTSCNFGKEHLRWQWVIAMVKTRRESRKVAFLTFNQAYEFIVCVCVCVCVCELQAARHMRTDQLE